MTRETALIRTHARRPPRIALALLGPLLLLSGLADAQQTPAPTAHLAGRAAVEALIGNSMTGTSNGAPYFAYYEKGGEVRMKRGRDVETGHWAADEDRLCEEYPDDEDETCYTLDLDGAQGVMTDEDGTSYAITVLRGNPEKL